MKFSIMFGALILGILFSLYPSIYSKKPLWWKLLAATFVSLSLILTIFPPISATIYDAEYLKSGIYKYLNIHIKVNKNNFIKDEANNYWKKVIGIDKELVSNFDSLDFKNKLIIKTEILPEEFKKSNDLVIKAKYNLDQDALEYIETVAINPFLDYPFVVNLEERIRILNLHVPLAWVSVVAYLMSMIYAIKYLKTKDLTYDIYTSSTASLGTFFAILATVTGMLWAKYNWGAYWNWDPRQTSIFILIMIYAAYFVLRSAIDNEERKARLSSVYSIISFVTVPFLVFILPRLSSGLHPGSKDDVNAGPLVSSQQNSLDTTLIYGFGLALFSFIILYFWLLNLKIRQQKLLFNK